jgi:hypothetical protein
MKSFESIDDPMKSSGGDPARNAGGNFGKIE